ncbi:oligosaccharide repeat unit polymerase [Lactiplantibacillus pentosus]|uniref:oligosaccharide repeat unit polymerase n=1 Tax=Lactiplantibacillus pentosus TaxID=1589 RepID=UPI00333E3FBE
MLDTPLGNVYTTFYAFLYDFGYKGVVVLVMLMSLVSQFIFGKVRQFSRQGDISIYALIYGRIAVCLILSFFSDKFYEGIFAITFIKTVIWWIILRWVFVRHTVEVQK